MATIYRTWPLTEWFKGEVSREMKKTIYISNFGYIVFDLVFIVFDAVMCGMNIQKGDWPMSAFFAFFMLVMCGCLIGWMKIIVVEIIGSDFRVSTFGMKER